MYIRNEKVFKICMLISVVCNVVYWLIALLGNTFEILELIAGIALLGGIVGACLCGLLGIAHGVGRGIFLATVFLPIINIVLYVGAFCFVLGFGCAFPGVIALIGWFKYRDYLH